MDRTTFEGLVKDALANMYDAAALETHPQLFSVFIPPSGYSGRKGEYIRQALTNAIEQLRPERKETNLSLPEWRPYVILHRRYVEGVSLQDLAAQLSISDRQLRRDQHRAIQALAMFLWNQLYPDQPARWDETEPAEETPQQYAIQETTIDLYDTLRSVHQVLAERLREEGTRVTFDFQAPSAPVETDRIILRQILISLFNEALRQNPGGELLVRVQAEGSFVTLEFEGRAASDRPMKSGDEEISLGTVRLWSERIKAQFEEGVEAGSPTSDDKITRRRLRLPRAGQRVILVVDDQVPAINLFKRYLSQTTYTIVGVSRPEEVLPMARELRPAAITLDVMMPKLDGWEVLQLLKLDEETSLIPVIVCSAWEEAELSRSLRAAGFLKKPVTQKDLLEVLDRLGLLEPA